MSPTELQAVVGRLALAMARQRAVLEASDYDALESLLPECEAALHGLNAYTGGVNALRQHIDLLPASDRTELLENLERANVDHRIGRDLIGLAMQRGAALQGFAATQSEGATYSQEGGVSHAIGSLLSRKA